MKPPVISDDEKQKLLNDPSVQKFIQDKINEGMKTTTPEGVLQVSAIKGLQDKEARLISQMRDNVDAFTRLVPYLPMKVEKNDYDRKQFYADKSKMTKDALELDLQNDRLREQLENLYRTRIYVSLRAVPAGLQQHDEGMTFSYNGKCGALVMPGVELPGAGNKDNVQVITYGEYKECLLRACEIHWSKSVVRRDTSLGFEYKPQLRAPIIEVLGVAAD